MTQSTLYVAVLSSLETGLAMAQAGHAAHEFGAKFGRRDRMLCYSVDDLVPVLRKARGNVYVWSEPDLNGQITSIASDKPLPCKRLYGT